MKKIPYLLLFLVALALLTGCGDKSGQEPAPTSIPISNPQTGLADPNLVAAPPLHPISLPQGFGISVFAEGLQGPRMLAFGPDQQLYVSEPDTGRVLVLADKDRDGRADNAKVAAENLIEPSGIAFYEDGSLYVAETTRIIRLGDSDGDGFFENHEIITAGIAAGGNTNRSIIFSPNWQQMYLAIGSSCNVCQEDDPRRGTVMRFKPDGTDGLIFSKGLRVVIGMAFTPNDILWAAVSEREGLPEGLPPETIYAIYIDSDGGWPYCHAGRIIDPEFGKKDSCSEDLLSPVFELEAQSAPYGIEFYTGDQFPDSYNKDLFVALHGTGEGSEARGYKILNIPLGEGESGLVEDFAVGWVDAEGTPWGTPTDLIQGPDGDLFVSDETLGVIYRIYYVE
jgi:glucose/arabinose dehydrogenase